MPELQEAMYCSEQICIPPTFPYLLRQYAKAAIRTQPVDLLRWSTAYFRCLSLNLRPPIKPRLEYPIPKSHYGLTPGWLKTLLNQLENNITVPFKVLWDRWIGACLEHKNLIEILCLAGFTEPEAIPWFRFVAICASHLTENLTQTMILICEILTDEPEGGCATITLETFVDLYTFLAGIDASQPQTLYNLYFTDSLLSLYREPVVEKPRESVSTLEEEAEEESVMIEEEEVVEVDTGPVDDQLGVVISCPDVAPDDYKTEQFFLTKVHENESDELNQSIETVSLQLPGSQDDVENNPVEEQEEESETDEYQEEEKRESSVCDEEAVACEAVEEEEETNYMDEQLEELKQLLAGPVVVEDVVEIEGEEEPESLREEVYVDAIPGIGPVVSPALVEAVVKYMGECAKRQHGMVMPRNIRHFTCPPLELLQY